MRAVTESLGGSALPTRLISCKEGGGGARENLLHKLQVRKCKVLAKNHQLLIPKLYVC